MPELLLDQLIWSVIGALGIGFAFGAIVGFMFGYAKVKDES
jgi:hypothetical protein